MALSKKRIAECEELLGDLRRMVEQKQALPGSWTDRVAGAFAALLREAKKKKQGSSR